MRLNVTETSYSRSANTVGAVHFLCTPNNLNVCRRKCVGYVSVDPGPMFVHVNWDLFFSFSLFVIRDVNQGLISYVVRRQ